MRIAILSDTHNLLRTEVKEIISNCDAVIHGGDVASLKTLEQMKSAIGSNVPFYVVRGNNDREWAKSMSVSLKFELGGVIFFLVHNKKDVPKDLGDVQVVVYGHSHKYAKEMVDGRLWLNPGSCGKRRFYSAVTMAVLHLEGDAYRVERIELDTEDSKRVLKESLAKQVDFSEGKLVGLVTEIFARMDKGQTISYIARKVGMEEELVAQICRIRVTHPGVTPGGVVDKMEVNGIVIKSGK